MQGQDDVFCWIVARLDALNTSVADCFGTFVKECKNQKSCQSRKSVRHRATLCNLEVENAANCETHAKVEKHAPKSKKSGRIPVKSRKKYKRLLSIAVENVLYESLMCLRNALDDDADRWDAEVKVVLCAYGKDVFDNSCKKHTIAFKNLKAGPI